MSAKRNLSITGAFLVIVMCVVGFGILYYLTLMMSSAF
jgi:hypothetical protein